MVRILLGSLSLLLLAVLTVGAGGPANLDQALNAQRVLVDQRPYDAEAYNDLGNLLVLAGRLQEAEEAYRQAIESAPASTLARFNLSILLQQTDQPRNAMSELDALLAIDDRHAKAHYQLGTLFAARHQRKKALTHYAKAFAFDPELTFARNNPHLIDNPFATEAILLAERYAESSSSHTPRLYGDPQRIVDLMLQQEDEVQTTPESQQSDMPKVDVERSATSEPSEAQASDRQLDFLHAEGDDEDEEDEDDDENNRRALTNEDLDAGSSIGQARSGSRRGRPAIGAGGDTGRRGSRGVGNGRESAGRQRPAGRDRTGNTGSVRRRSSVGGSDGSSGRERYRPSSRFSTGRLELQLLPAEEEKEQLGVG